MEVCSHFRSHAAISVWWWLFFSLSAIRNSKFCTVDCCYRPLIILFHLAVRSMGCVLVWGNSLPTDFVNVMSKLTVALLITNDWSISLVPWKLWCMRTPGRDYTDCLARDAFTNTQHCRRQIAPSKCDWVILLLTVVMMGEEKLNRREQKAVTGRHR